MKINKTPKSDWLVFDWRQITWEKDTINYLIEIYPKFDSNEKISSWTFYTAACYDNGDQRFYLSKNFADNVKITNIADNAVALLADSYDFISNVKKEEIPRSENH